MLFKTTLDESVGTFRVSAQHTDGNAHFRFCNNTGRVILAAFSRDAKTSTGQRTLVINSQREDLSWVGEVTTKFPPDEDFDELEFIFQDWRISIRSRGGEIISLNPRFHFGEGCDISQISQVESSVPSHHMILQNSRNADGFLQRYLPQISDPTPLGLTGTVALIVIGSRPAHEVMHDASDCLYHYSEIEHIYLESSQPPEEWSEKLHESISKIKSDTVAVISGDETWVISEVSKIVSEYNFQENSRKIFAGSQSGTFSMGERWAVICPRVYEDKISITSYFGEVLLSPELLHNAYWVAPSNWKNIDDFVSFRRDTTRAPVAQDNIIHPSSILKRPAPQIFTLALSNIADATFQHANMPSSSSQTIIYDSISCRQIFARLRNEMNRSCSSHFAVIDLGHQENFPAFVTTGIAEDIAIFTDNAGKSVGFIASRDTLRDILDIQPAARNMNSHRVHIEGFRKTLSGTLEDLIKYLSDIGVAASFISAAHAARGLEIDRGEQKATPRLLPLKSVRSILAKARRGQQLRDAEAVIMQQIGNLLHYGLFTEACDLACEENYRMSSGQLVPHLVETLKAMGESVNDFYRVHIALTLTKFNYSEYAKQLLDLRPVRVQELSNSDIFFQWMELVIRRTLWDTASRDYVDLSVRELCGEHFLPEQLPHSLISTFMHYLALRENWHGIVRIARDLLKLGRIEGDPVKFYLMAKLHTGQLENFRKELIDAKGSISDWEWSRLNVWYAHLTRSEADYHSAVSSLLESEQDMAALLAPPSKFTLACGSLAPLEKEEIGCIIVARNEFTRLKWLVDYYRKLGVDRFFFIDNMSDDETVDYFSEFPDITILQTSENYRDSRYGVKWHNEVAAKYMPNNWVLTVDADEVFVFDESEKPKALRELCQRLEHEGAETMFTTMIDMYASERLENVTYEPGDSLIEKFPWFDGTGYRCDPSPACPPMTVSGGPRVRVFWNDRRALDMPHMAMQKAPLVRWSRNAKYFSSTHEMAHCKVSTETGALLHFKFLPDFHQRAMEEVRRSQHYEGAREYLVYSEQLTDPRNRGFMYEGSTFFESSQTLISMGLISPFKREETNSSDIGTERTP